MKQRVVFGSVSSHGFLRRHPFSSLFLICAAVAIGASVCAWRISEILNRQEAIGGDENLQFESTESFAGQVFGGDSYRFEFPFKNPTNHDVEITGTISGCRCTDVTAVPKRIPAGQSGVITGEMRLRDRQGKFTERLVVKTNTQKQYILTVQADVIGRYIVTPRKIDFSDVWWDDVLKGTVYITSQDGLDFPEPLTIAPGLHRSVNAEIKRSEKGKWCVDIELSFPEAEGLIEDKLTIETSSPQWTLHIPIVAYVTNGK